MLLRLWQENLEWILGSRLKVGDWRRWIFNSRDQQDFAAVLGYSTNNLAQIDSDCAEDCNLRVCVR
jgi:hypothetical protein